MQMWKRLASMPTARGDIACVADGNNITVLGGWLEDWSQPRTTVEARPRAHAPTRLHLAQTDETRACNPAREARARNATFHPAGMHGPAAQA